MGKIKIIADSCSDLKESFLSEFNIAYVRMETVYNGNSLPAELTWTAEEAHDLYEKMRNGEIITTAQVPVDEFKRVFEFYLDQEYDIIYIACSSKQSGSVNTGNVVAKNILTKYPERKIACIDSLNASIGIGMLVIEAAKMANDNIDFDSIVSHIMSLRNKVNQYCTVHTLDYLKRAGRVKGSSAFFGNLLGVKPIIVSDCDGVQTPIKKVKGRSNSLKEIVALLKASIKNPENQTVYIAHGDCSAEELQDLTNMIKDEIPCKNVDTWFIGPIVGASIGPDAIGVWAFGEEVTLKNGSDN